MDKTKEFNLDIEYNYKPMKESKNKVITNLFIEYLVNKKYKDGISGQEKRIWIRIQTKLGDAIDSDETIINLNDLEIGFLKKLNSDEVAIPVGDAVYFDKLEQAIEAL